ncbi:hypothetical protein DITRI_Ditri10aG0030700 [Diplodiscus trichospermus]
MDSSSAPRTPGRNSDIDFNDVFGGPPRRSSIQERRYSFSENTDSSPAFRRSDETVSASRNPWSGLREKPVFGEEGMSRRRYSRNNFYDDIYGGNESLSSSPRNHEMRDPFPAGSQLLSPARPLPPKAEPFASSFPAQFSLPAKLNKGMDIPTLGSPTRSTSKSKDGFSNDSSYYAQSVLSRLSGQANQDKEEVRNDFQLYDETETKGNSKEETSSSEFSENGSHFHFSIYKWANKGGVPLAIPLRGSDRLKKMDKLQRCSSSNGRIACESIAAEPKAKLHDIFQSTDKMSSNAKSFRVEHDKNENGSLIASRNEDEEPGQIIEEDKIPKSETEIISRLQSSDGNEQEKTCHTLPRMDLCDRREKEISAVGKETHKPQLKPVNLLFHDDNNDEQANDKMTRNAGTKDISEKSAKTLSETLDGKNIKKQDVKKRATSNNVEASTKTIKGSPRNSWDNGKGRVRGKVKEFIQFFNQDASSKPRAYTVSESHSSRWKERHNVKPENGPSIGIIERNKKIHITDMQRKKSSPDVAAANHTCHNASDRDTNSSVKDTVSDGSKTIFEDPAESFEDNFLIEDLTPEEKILPQFGIDPKEIQAIDAKIRQWSNGKQGNIRSLLSTLQYVLWPDSGWKPVPLVDIIEGPTVKRSYQKALLYLHPDKLQQKGATSDQKYIAEKVFDILQDAWTQFNSLGSV